MDLINVSSGVVANPTSENDLMNAKTIGKDAATKFLSQRLNTGECELHAPIRKLRLQLFSNNFRKPLKDEKGATAQIPDRKLFTRLLIIGKERNVDLKQVLSHSLRSVSYPLASTDGS